MKIICAWAQAPATPEKGDSQRVAKWPIVEYQILVLISFFRLYIEQLSDVEHLKDLFYCIHQYVMLVILYEIWICRPRNAIPSFIPSSLSNLRFVVTFFLNVIIHAQWPISFCIQTFWRRFMLTNEAANSFPLFLNRETRKEISTFKPLFIYKYQRRIAIGINKQRILESRISVHARLILNFLNNYPTRSYIRVCTLIYFCGFWQIFRPNLDKIWQKLGIFSGYFCLFGFLLRIKLKNINFSTCPP